MQNIDDAIAAFVGAEQAFATGTQKSNLAQSSAEDIQQQLDVANGKVTAANNELEALKLSYNQKLADIKAAADAAIIP